MVTSQTNPKQQVVIEPTTPEAATFVAGLVDMTR